MPMNGTRSLSDAFLPTRVSSRTVVRRFGDRRRGRESDRRRRKGTRHVLIGMRKSVKGVRDRHASPARLARAPGARTSQGPGRRLPIATQSTVRSRAPRDRRDRAFARVDDAPVARLRARRITRAPDATAHTWVSRRGEKSRAPRGAGSSPARRRARRSRGDVPIRRGPIADAPDKIPPRPPLASQARSRAGTRNAPSAHLPSTIAAMASRGASAAPSREGSSKVRSALTSAFEELAMHTTQKSPEVRARARRAAPNARTRRPRPEAPAPPPPPPRPVVLFHRGSPTERKRQSCPSIGARRPEARPTCHARDPFFSSSSSAATDKLRLLSPPSLPPSVASPSRTPDRPDPPLRFLPFFFSQGDCFSARTCTSRAWARIPASPSAPPWASPAPPSAGVASPSRNINSSGRKTSVFDPDPDELARSQGRQHGELQHAQRVGRAGGGGRGGAAEFAARSSRPAGVAIQREDSGPLFSFNGGESKFTSNETNEMSYTWNPGGGLSALASERGGGGRSPDGSEDSERGGCGDDAAAGADVARRAAAIARRLRPGRQHPRRVHARRRR